MLATVGYLGTSFATNIHVIIFTFGIVSGTGFGFMQMGAICQLYRYFDHRQALALGVFTSCFSVSQFLWPPVTTLLFQSYGWRGSFVIMAGVQLNLCIIGALMRPFPANKSDPQNGNKITLFSYLTIQFRVFKNKPFVCYCGTLLIVYSAYFYIFAYLPTLADNIGISETKAALLVSIVGKLKYRKKTFFKTRESTFLFLIAVIGCVCAMNFTLSIGHKLLWIVDACDDHHMISFTVGL